MAKRLTQGMSSAPQAYSGKSKPPAGPNSATNAVFQLDRDTYDDILAANEANSNMNNPAMNPYPNQIHPGGQGMASPQQMNQMTMQQQMNMFPGYGGVGSGGVGLNMIPGYNNPSEGSMHPRISK